VLSFFMSYTRLHYITFSNYRYIPKVRTRLEYETFLSFQKPFRAETPIEIHNM
jgi:hypothetical protein